MTDTTYRGPMLTLAQLRKLMALYKGVERADRLQGMSIIVSRRITTASELTAGEASLIIDRVEREQEQPAW